MTHASDTPIHVMDLNGPFFVIASFDGITRLVESFVGAGALDAAEALVAELRQGWSEVHLCAPVGPACTCGTLRRTLKPGDHRSTCPRGPYDARALASLVPPQDTP